MESALSPNTAAFLQYISSQMSGEGSNSNSNDDNNNKSSVLPQSANPSIQQQLATSTTSLPPSAFFQIPESTTSNTSNGLSTPASKSVSPVDTKPAHHSAGRSASLSSNEEGSPDNASGSRPAPAKSGAGIDHKRKAGLHHLIEETGDEEGKFSPLMKS